MRLYKYISPILLFLLITGVVLNTDSLNTNYFGRNYINEKDIHDYNELKKSIDVRISSENNALSILDSDSYKLVQAAYKEIGNVGGEKFWSWYGFSSYQPWCACFVSWCADQCGFIESGIIPKFSAVSYGASWFINRGQWLWGYEVPAPGMIVFFDFTNADLADIRDGMTDHVGIVKNVQDGYVYCIEGNYRNTCTETKYEIGHFNILGYGTPDYRK